MPNRILREGILTSEPVNELEPRAELFYRRLMSVVDDFGRYYASEKLLRPACYPLQIDRVREADISRWRAECAKAGVILLYTVDSKEYLVLRKTDPPRAKFSKFPGPPADICAQMHAREDIGPHVRPYADSGSNAHSDADAKEEPAAEAGGGGSGGRGLDGMPPIPAGLATPPFLAAWADFERHRREKKQRLTPTAAGRALAKLAEMGAARATAAVNHSIEKGWTGIFEPADETKGPGHGKRGGPKPTPEQRGEYGGLTELGVRRLGGSQAQVVPAGGGVAGAVPGGPAGPAA